MDAPAIEMRAVRHTYDDEVLHGIDLTIEHGEIFGFLGHNGAGKTTAINILTTLLEPTGGTALVCGHDVVNERADVTERIGYLPADVRLYGHMTARENLEFFAKLSDDGSTWQHVAPVLGEEDHVQRALDPTRGLGVRHDASLGVSLVHGVTPRGDKKASHSLIDALVDVVARAGVADLEQRLTGTPVAPEPWRPL